MVYTLYKGESVILIFLALSLGLAVCGGGGVHAQSPASASCVHNYFTFTNYLGQPQLATSGDTCMFNISPPPTDGSVIMFTTSGWLVNGKVIPNQIPVQFNGSPTLQIPSLLTVATITYNGTVLYVRPLP